MNPMRYPLPFKDPRLIWLLGATLIASLVALTSFHHVISYVGWRYLHIVSAAIFSGVVSVSALFEHLAFKRGDLSLIAAYHELVQELDKVVITVSVSALLTSAIALLKYQGYELWSIQEWPLWASSALVLISLNGLFWMAFDVTNQHELSGRLRALDVRSSDHASSHQAPSAHDASSDHALLMRALSARARVNLASVSVIPIVYYLMVFKPSFELFTTVVAAITGVTGVTESAL